MAMGRCENGARSSAAGELAQDQCGQWAPLCVGMARSSWPAGCGQSSQHLELTAASLCTALRRSRGACADEEGGPAVFFPSLRRDGSGNVRLWSEKTRRVEEGVRGGGGGGGRW